MKVIFIAFNWMEHYDLYKEYKEYIDMFKSFHILTANNITDRNCTKDLFATSDCILKLKDWGANSEFEKRELNMAIEMGKPIYDENTIGEYLQQNKIQKEYL